MDLDLSHAFIGTSVRVRLLLYTSETGMCGTLMSHTDPTAHPQFNTSRPTTFLIHGYRPTGSPPRWLTTITELLLARTDMNLIVVDWNNGAANVNYFKAVENTHTVADNLTVFLEKLKVCVSGVCVCRRPQDNHKQMISSFVVVFLFLLGKRRFHELHSHDRNQSRSSYIRICWCQYEGIHRKNHR